jgi:hypothetical protein
MNSQILFLASQERSARLSRQAESRRRQRAGSSRPSPDRVTIRLAGERDRAAIERLSQLEGRRLDGALLVAEVGGDVRAALAIHSGEPIADPFRGTGDLIELLERRRAHLNGGRGSRLARIRAALRGRRSHATYPRSAPTVLGNETSLLR